MGTQLPDSEMVLPQDDKQYALELMFVGHMRTKTMERSQFHGQSYPIKGGEICGSNTGLRHYDEAFPWVPHIPRTLPTKCRPFRARALVVPPLSIGFAFTHRIAIESVEHIALEC